MIKFDIKFCSNFSSVCDSPPPSGASTASRKESPPAMISLDSSLKSEMISVPDAKGGSKENVVEKEPLKETESKVVLRNKGKSPESQRRALATRFEL